MKIYGIYDTKNHEQCIRIGTLQEIIRFLNISARCINKTINKHCKLLGRYELVFLYTEPGRICKAITI